MEYRMSEAFDATFRFEPQNVLKIVVHENGPGNACPDGVAAALLLREALPHAQVVFRNYELLDVLPPEPGVLFCDICPSPESAPAWFEAGAYVLDHHATRKDVVAKFGRRGVYSDEAGVSGAVLAYRHVFMPWIKSGGGFPRVGGFPTQRQFKHERAEYFANLAGVRDTWRKTDERWREACEQAEALRFWPWYEWPLDPFGRDEVEFAAMLSVGRVLYAKSIEDAKRLAGDAKHVTTANGTRVAIIPTTHTSDVAELVDADVLVGFKYRYEPSDDLLRLQLSFRSRTGYDVSALAKSLGGGGHRAAAGATLTAGSGRIVDGASSNQYFDDSVSPYMSILDAIGDHETHVEILTALAGRNP